MENELYSSEKMASAAALLQGKNYPKQAFEEAEKPCSLRVHDALPGSGTQLVEEDTLRLLDHGLEILSREKLKAAIALTEKRKSWTEAPAPLSIILILSDLAGQFAFWR